MSAPTWNDRFELPGESRFLSDIQDYLSMSWKNTEKIVITHQWEYVNKIEDRIRFKIKTRFCIEF